MPDVIWNELYAPAQAEDGKFLPIDTNSLTSLGYPTSGFGKFALLTYQINPSDISLSAGTIQVPSEVSAVQLGNWSINVIAANTLWIGTSSCDTMTIYTPTLPSLLKSIEIQNKTGGSIYFIASTTTFAEATANGIEIADSTYYSLDRDISAFSIAVLSSGSVRVMGHYIV